MPQAKQQADNHPNARTSPLVDAEKETFIAEADNNGLSARTNSK
jgi:hypothetical protein